MTNFIAPAVNAIRQWADLSGGDAASATQTSIRQAKKPFDEQYPRLNHPLTLNDSQRLDLMGRLGFSTVGDNELYLALSRTPSDTNPVNVANIVRAIITHWRAGHSEDSDVAASRKLLEGNSALLDIDSRLQAAKLASETAEREHKEFERQYHNFRSIPAQFEQLTSKINDLELSAKQIKEYDYDALISQHLEAQFNPRPGVQIAGSIGELLVARETRDLKLKVIAGLLEQCKAAIEKLADDSKRLAKVLDLPAHNI
jgi:hypothetical protein